MSDDTERSNTGRVVSETRRSLMSDEVPPPIYNVPFAWDSSHGHMVELLVEHVEPGLVVDIGCGYAPHAERLVQRGFQYVGVDADAESVANLRDRGFGAATADANNSAVLLAALDAVVPEDASIAAVIALDVLEHLVSPHLTLHEIARWMSDRGVGTFGVSLPNVTHDDVVLKLMTGRFDLTPSGLLDHTHLRFFTDASVTAMMGAVGLVETKRHDVCSPKTDQQWPEAHPALSDGALLGTYLRRARALSDAHGQTFQFVRLFQLDADRSAEPTLLAERPGAPRQAITVLVEPGCSDDQFASLTSAMSAQRDGSVEVVRLQPDDDGRRIIDQIDTSYVSIVRGDEQFDDRWAAQLLAVADRFSTAVLRAGPLAGDAVDAERHDIEWNASFALFEHYLAQWTPGAALAFPAAFLRELSELWPSDVATIDTHALLIEASAVCGVVDTGTAAVAPVNGWRADPEVAAQALQRLAGAPRLMSSGAPTEIALNLDRLRAAGQRVAELEGEVEALRTDVAWLNGELARRPVRLARKAQSVFDRLRRR